MAERMRNFLCNYLWEWYRSDEDSNGDDEDSNLLISERSHSSRRTLSQLHIQCHLLNLSLATFNNCTVKFYVQSSAGTDHAEPKRRRRALVIKSDSELD